MIGQLLREAREAKGCTLEEAERATRIRAKYLAALEAEDFGALPSAIQARGFLRNYAQFLGLEVSPLLAEHARLSKKTGLALPLTSRPSRPAARPRATAAPPASDGGIQVRPRRLLSADVLVAALLTIALGLLLLWGGSQLLTSVAAGATGTPTAEGTAAPPSLTATAAAPIVEAALPATQPLPTPLPNYTGVHVLVRAEQRLWLRVTIDGVEDFAGLMRPGESKEFIGRQVIELVTGNGKGTHVVWNGIDQGTLGDVGEVVARLWTLEGMVIPTPTITPTPTVTPPPTRTPRP